MIAPISSQSLNTLIDECQHKLTLNFGPLKVQVHSNASGILEELKSYYKSYAFVFSEEQTIDVYAVEAAEITDSIEWQEVPREAGKQGRKEGYVDSFSDKGEFEGRWIKKFKTGMVMLQRIEKPVAIGPCLENMAQIINFINNQFLNLHIRQGFLLGHASGFSVNGEVTAIAASSGGGKSTLMLRCLEDESRQFVTNDRILMRHTNEGVEAVGVAKLPRVNPGTLLHSHKNRLRHILTQDRQQQLLEMAPEDLWELEEKYDVQIEDEYGAGRVGLTGQLKRLIMLDWSFSSNEETRIEAVNLDKEPNAIEGLRKRPGPFYQDSAGEFADLTACDSTETYCQGLEGVKVYRLTGGIDFDKAYELIAGLEG